MENTQNQTRTKEEIEKLIAKRIVPQTREEADEAVIDSDNYGEMSIPHVLAAKTLCSYFKDSELLAKLGNSINKEEDLATLILAQTYIEKSKDPQTKEKIKQAAIAGNYQQVLDMISFENHTKMSPGKLKEIALSSILLSLSEVTKQEKTAEFSFEELSGQLGTGIRMTYEKDMYEHRDVNKTTKMRIMKTNDKYKVIIHLDSVGSKVGYSAYKSLFGVANAVLGSSLGMDLKAYFQALKKQTVYDGNDIKIRIGTTVESDPSIKYGYDSSGINVLFNTKDNYWDKKKLKLPEGVELMEAIVGVFGGVGLVMGGLLSSNHYLIPIGGALISNVVATGCGHPFLFRSVQNIKNHYYKNKYLATDQILRNMKETVVDKESVEGSSQLEKLLSNEEKAFEALSETFQGMKYLKGYSVEFTSDKLDEAYMKAYQIIEGVKLVGGEKVGDGKN